MRKLKVMTIIGTRPDIIKLSEIIKRCDVHFEHVLVHTGQNYDYELNQAFFEDLGLRAPDFYLNVAGSNLGETMGNVLGKSYNLMATERPDALLVLGDTNSALCVISAKRLKIPIFHLEAGNRCFDENLPEEVNRRIVDHTSDVNLCYTEHARRYLYAEGLRKEYTFVVGSPMKEVLDKNRQTIEASDVLSRLSLDLKQYFLVSAHREENIDIEANFISLMNAINALAEQFAIPVIYSVHPRSEKFIKARGFVFHPNVRAMKPFNFSDYVTLQKNAYCVVSDSGTLPEEASYFRFPAVSIRTSTERPEAVDKGNFIIGGITEESLLQAVQLTVRLHELGENGAGVPDYSDDNVSAKVVGIIQGYVGVINRMVWRK
ncbi:non-hydrolyzing UDP-N-acetylglucosamine 2-epimerase [Paenibacillus glycinis]|uniref:UDP-N-acetylglucosamine 2-epimerase (Non-hydrolyzing) n=1 Tax=Paenibacillus glycinis TaxID=2697035 RepID=A0ABW9XVR8_9BACL|nr:UDP-N-acetylglucosamine 2-epimerase (non-hydrolyzing) [Paenibacillus glycinis]NBD26695.1 UDP-N-acetylglucosamine 2-epimerase (non-hydrolyzing) [Paenibacillus glycinis]